MGASMHSAFSKMKKVEKKLKKKVWKRRKRVTVTIFSGYYEVLCKKGDSHHFSFD